MTRRSVDDEATAMVRRFLESYDHAIDVRTVGVLVIAFTWLLTHQRNQNLEVGNVGIVAWLRELVSFRRIRG